MNVWGYECVFFYVLVYLPIGFFINSGNYPKNRA